MENCGSMFKGVLVAIALVVMAQYGSAAEKLDSCCTTVSRKKITDPIIGYYTQRPNPPCVTAIIFQTEKGYFCSYLRSPWVLLKIRAFNNAKARDAASSTAPASSTVSLLSIITSTAASSTPPRSSSPTPLSSSTFPSSSSSFPSSSSSPSFPSSSPSFPSSSPSFPSSSPSFLSFSLTSEIPAGETLS
ncbi:hypothetical protein CgunFtcFv8_015407 [Champsocephalus gunnari]|uniref:Chemokine interleukin-8-like domain-containing protein n=1 Tax=Champsocephalus gunnari TaxID=52237 RepID=A0AAN8C9C7_CHAGU|nr:hypothetical protein CgunFtcFv8_015407 [Champsocephalus gunnari]